MARSPWLTILIVPLTAACAPEAVGTTPPGDDSEDDSTGGGGDANWRVAGKGSAFFGDGDADNSLFQLSMSQCADPRDGEAYYGWVSSTTTGQAIAVGEIPVSAGLVEFAFDLGENAIIGRLDHFEAYANDSGEAEGDLLWTGTVNATVFDVVQALLIGSDDTPDGQGSLRSMESQIEALAAYALEVAEEGGELPELKAEAERLANGLSAPARDHDGDGSVSEFDSYLALAEDLDDCSGGYVGLILDDLTGATQALQPTDPIRDFIDPAYDAIQMVCIQAQEADRAAGIAVRSGAADAAQLQLEEFAARLGDAQVGVDLDGDGTIEQQITDEPGTEYGLDGALTLVSKMAQMAVETP
jgi:hypothetical protein